MNLKEKLINASKSELFQLFVQPERWASSIERCIEKEMERGLLNRFLMPEYRQIILQLIVNGDYQLSPPHSALIPKDEPGEFREVFVCEPMDRLILSVLYSAIMDCKAFKTMIHPACRSYLKGVGCGKTVQEVSRICQKKIAAATDGSVVLGAKYDFHHYFDTVSREAIYSIFDEMERRLGFKKNTEALINFLRIAWASDTLLVKENGEYVKTERYMGIRQGNAVGAFLADVVLYELDDYMSRKYEYYVRYSDDLIVLGSDPVEITADINSIVIKYGVSLNLKKTQVLTSERAFKFLGFMIKGNEISISPGRLKKFQHEIDIRTVDCRNKSGARTHKFPSYSKAVKDVMKYLYIGDGVHSWSSQLFPIVTRAEDIQTMNYFVMDRLRAVATQNKKGLMGIGYNSAQNKVDYNPVYRTIRNRLLTEKELAGYRSLYQMWDCLNTHPAVFAAEVNDMINEW